MEFVKGYEVPEYHVRGQISDFTRREDEKMVYSAWDVPWYSSTL